MARNTSRDKRTGDLMSSIRDITRPGDLPFLLGITFLIFAFVYRSIDLPQPAELAEIGRTLYFEYGIIVLLLAAFIEGIFMVNFYFPGSFVILLAVFLSDKSPESLAAIILLSVLGFLLATVINYGLGKYGFYRALLWMGKANIVERMQKWLDKRGRWAVGLTGVHPNLLAIAVVCMGIAGEGILKTSAIAAASLVFWVSLSIIVIAMVISQVNIEDPNQHWYIFGAFILWGLFLIGKKQIPRLIEK